MNDYPRFHQDRTNLLIHIFMVPVFALCALGALGSLVAGHGLRSGLFAAGSLLSMAVQGAGHRREPNPPLPFKGPGDFLGRIFAEQFYRFPIFALGGGWMRAWRRERP
jgi:hypothetical protein